MELNVFPLSTGRGTHLEMGTVGVSSLQASAGGALEGWIRVCSLPAWFYTRLTQEVEASRLLAIGVLRPAGLVACCSYVKYRSERLLLKLSLVWGPPTPTKWKTWRSTEKATKSDE